MSPLESKVSIRYGGQRVPLYRQDGLYNWYELLCELMMSGNWNLHLN